MIGYSPIEFYEPHGAQPPPQPQVVHRQMDFSECNYIVMFFIVGVILLAITDLIGKQNQ